MIAITVYLDRNDPKDIVIMGPNGYIDLTNITQVDLVREGCGLTISSAVPAQASMFDWSVGNGVLRLNLGTLDIAPGVYTFYVILYDAGWPLGIPWNKITISFLEICATP